MGELLFELEQNLRKTKENLSSKEANVMMQCRANCVRDFTLGFGGASALTWLATRKLHHLLRFNLTAGTSFMIGMWTFRRSLDSCVQHILSLDGTRMQRELGTLMLKKYQDDPLIMQRVSKHFYSEEVYDDSSDQPRLRWRFRNFFGESVAFSRATEDHESYIEKSDEKRTDLKKISIQSKQDQMNGAVETMENPFDCIFGLPARVDEIHHSDTFSRSPRKIIRAHKRSHRRHRKHHLEGSDG